MTAHASGISAYGSNTSDPGRRITSVPSSPTPTAVQRSGPTRSPSSGTDSAATTSGKQANSAWISAMPR